MVVMVVVVPCGHASCREKEGEGECYVLAQKTTCQSDFESDNNEGA